MITSNPFSLSGKRALIAGASRGIGLAIARQVARAGAHTILASRSLAQLEAHAASLREEGHRAEAIALDIADPQSVEDVASSCGEIDILINVSGINKRMPMEDYSQEEYNRILQTNLHGVFTLTQLVAKDMLARGRGGKVIFIGSVSAMVGMPKISVYAITKGGLHALTRELAAEWGKHNIQVNCIAPGFILTDLNREMWQSEKMLSWMRGAQAIPRLGSPEDIAPLAVFLASPGSDFITGQVIAADGGYTTTAVWPYE